MDTTSEQLCDLPRNGSRRINVQSVLSAENLSMLANSNNEASTEELAECRRIALEGKQDATDLADEIAKARAHLEHLETELEDLQHAIQVQQAILQSPRRLSKDILIEIFQFACQSDAHDTALELRHSLDIRRPLWCIGQVCSAWRVLITEQMPRLWTQATLRVADKHAKQRFLLEHFLRRSKGHPLDVSLLFDTGYGAESPYNLLLHAFEMSCDRWRSLHLEGWIYDLDRWDQSYLEGNMPLLEHFSHQIHSTHVIDLSHWTAFLRCPRLTKVEILGWSNLHHNHIAWDKLTSLTWNSAHKFHADTLVYGSFPDLLRMCTNLQECELDCVFQRNNVSPPNMITLPHLRSLALHTIVEDSDMSLFIERGESETDRILQTLRLPALSALVITGILYRDTSVVEFIQGSQCRLQALRLATKPPSEPHQSLHSILTVAPTLTSLHIIDDISPNIINTIASLLGIVFSDICLFLRSLVVDFSAAKSLAESLNSIDVGVARLRSSTRPHRKAARVEKIIRVGQKELMKFNAHTDNGLLQVTEIQRTAS